MNYLKIDNNQVWFRTDKTIETYKAIDEVNKEDILNLVKLIIEEDNFEMAEYNSEIIGNTAHNIIYKNIYEKLNALKHNRTEIIEEANSEFSAAFNKYKEK